jgi:anti-anti-sigma regulatory factor
MLSVTDVVEPRPRDEHASAAAQESDRCPYPRPFPADFDACPAFHPVTYVVADSTNAPIGPVVSCRHLVSGSTPNTHGRYYARCALGSPAARRGWLERFGADRLNKVRELQAEFDLFSRPYREQLMQLKAEAVHDQNGEADRGLRRSMGDFLKAVDAFLIANEHRLRELALPVGPLKHLVHEWSWAWAGSSSPSATFADDPVLPFAAADTSVLTFDQLKARRETNGQLQVNRVYSDDLLRIDRTVEPPGLSLSGEVDASNVHALTQSLALAAVPRGDYHLDLSGLSFCDLGGFRAIVRTARNLGPGRRLIVKGMPMQLWRAFRIVGWAELPNLVVVPTWRDSEVAK